MTPSSAANGWERSRVSRPIACLYIGSASKRLAPGMRLGWMIPPSWLSWSLISAKAIEDAGSETSGQLALADFIARGELERHLRRMRLRYAQRHRTLMAALERELPRWRPHRFAGGLKHEFGIAVQGPRELPHTSPSSSVSR